MRIQLSKVIATIAIGACASAAAAAPTGLVGADGAAATAPSSAAADPVVTTTGVAGQKGGQTSQGPLDEVIVNARKEKLSQLRKQIEKAQDAMYDTYNRINKVPEYQVYCRTETSTATRMPIHQCKPRLVNDATEAEATAFLHGEPFRPSGSVINEKMPDFEKHLRDVIRRNPKLHQAVLDYGALVKHYEVVRREKFKGKWIIWDP